MKFHALAHLAHLAHLGNGAIVQVQNEAKRRIVLAIALCIGVARWLYPATIEPVGIRRLSA